MIRRTKIIATLGYSTDAKDSLEQLLSAQVDLVRLNLSHGSIYEHKNRLLRVRDWSKKYRKEIGVIADLQGPKIRIGPFKGGTVTLKASQPFVIDTNPDIPGDTTRVGISDKNILNDILPGDILLLKDGEIKLRVDGVKFNNIHCTVLNDGILSSMQGLNRFGGGLSLPTFTDKDLKDIEYAKQMNVDYLAISFVKEASDIKRVKSLLGEDSHIRLIAKIERKEALDQLNEIILASDGVMVARGDLGIEIGVEEVPAVQKHIIHQARDLNKPVITATQMMESMITQSTPTRAEVSDIANAVLDGTDAIMFSSETATGKHPELVVKTASQICISAERNPISKISHHRIDEHFSRFDEAIAMASMYIANHLNIRAIVAFTESGTTPLWMSRIRSSIPIYALSRHIQTERQMSLYRDVYPLFFDLTRYEKKQGNNEAISMLQKLDLISKGDQIIVTQGEVPGLVGATNELKIITVK